MIYRKSLWPQMISSSPTTRVTRWRDALSLKMQSAPLLRMQMT